LLAFQMGEMSSYQKRRVITLIPKKTKKRALLDNWKPMSLLNTNYKIATIAIAARISKVLAFLINGDQTSFVKKKTLCCTDCTFNCRYYRMRRMSGIALFLDFKKVIVSIEWDFIFKARETFGLAPP